MTSAGRMTSCRSNTVPTNPCFACAVSCCSAFRIYLTPFDLARITLGLSLPDHAVCLPVQVSLENADHEHLSFSLGEEERFLLGLRRRRTGCLFLLRIGNQRRCGIHPLRPLVCRCYPHTLHGNRVMVTRQALCPAPWPLSADQKQSFVVLHRQRERESFLYQSLLDTWHEEGLPSLERSGIARRDFGKRFRSFLSFLAGKVSQLREP